MTQAHAGIRSICLKFSNLQLLNETGK